MGRGSTGTVSLVTRPRFMLITLATQDVAGAGATRLDALARPTRQVTRAITKTGEVRPVFGGCDNRIQRVGGRILDARRAPARGALS